MVTPVLDFICPTCGYLSFDDFACPSCDGDADGAMVTDSVHR
jgi:rubrerythrin